MHSVSVSVHEASGVMPCLRMDGGVAGRATAYGGKERQGVLESNGVTDTGTHATLFTVMGSHRLTQDSAGRPTLSLKLMVDAAFRMTVVHCVMADVSLAAMAGPGVTAADHERISRRKTVLLKHASGRDDHIPPNGTA